MSRLAVVALLPASLTSSLSPPSRLTSHCRPGLPCRDVTLTRGRQSPLQLAGRRAGQRGTGCGCWAGQPGRVGRGGVVTDNLPGTHLLPRLAPHPAPHSALTAPCQGETQNFFSHFLSCAGFLRAAAGLRPGPPDLVLSGSRVIRTDCRGHLNQIVWRGVRHSLQMRREIRRRLGLSPAARPQTSKPYTSPSHILKRLVKNMSDYVKSMKKCLIQKCRIVGNFFVFLLLRKNFE